MNQKKIGEFIHCDVQKKKKADTTGLTNGSKCSACGEILTAQETIPALGHTFENYKCTCCGMSDIAPEVKPEGLGTVNNGKEVQITWSAMEGADEYEVYLVKGEEEIKVGTITDLSFKYTDAKPGESYQFKVYGVNNTTGKKSTAATTTVKAYLTKAKISGVKKTSGKNIQVKWKKVTGAVSYTLYRKTGDGKWKKIGNTTGTKFIDKKDVKPKLKKNKTYTYRVRAVAKDGSYINGEESMTITY